MIIEAAPQAGRCSSERRATMRFLMHTSHVRHFGWGIFPVAFLALATPVFAARLSAIGVLTCTTSGEKSAAHQSLSCTFNGVAGRDGSLRGEMTLRGQATLQAGRHALMWSVLGHSPRVELPSLAGHYKEVAPGELRGGRNDKFTLRPLTGASRAHDQAITSLDLRLASPRA